jgi:3-oxoacyl-[acyl-carrier protein] reductase
MGIELKQRVAIITGGANGIGKQTALTFGRAGATVVIWDMIDEQGQETVKEITEAGGKAAFFKVNVTSQAEVQAAVDTVVDQFQRVDILVNNAGITRDSQLVRVKNGEVVGKMKESDFDAVISVNLKGVFNCAQAVAPIMIRQGHGRIINAASVVALYGNFGQTNYVASKSAVIGMTKVWARELGKRGITVNAIAPGFIDTAMTQSMPEHVLAEMVSRTPIGRIGKPQDIANAYLFLASDEASFISGLVMNVDGGLVMGT